MTDKTCPTPEPFNTMIGNILLLTLLFFLTFISRFIFAPLMPTIGADLGLTSSQAGSIFLMGSAGFFFASILSGFVAARINHRGTLILSIIGVGLALIACAFSASLWALQVVMLILGVAAGLNLPSNMATITAMVSREDWGKALAIQQMAPPLSLVLGPLLSVLLLSWFSWQITLAALGVFSIIALFASVRLGTFGDFPGDAPIPGNVKQVLAGRSFWIMVILFALGMGGQVGIYAMLPLYLVTERGMDSSLANTLLGLSQISALFMTFFAGWMTDRTGERTAIALFLVASGLVTVLLGILTGSWLKVIVFVQPALIVCFFPAGFSALARIVQPNLRSLATALATPTAFVLGGGLLPAALGYMGQAHTFGLGIALTGALMIFGASLVLWLQLLEKMDEGC
jgi:NNP family nitrate/nitrite transporter-like MFS transporter